MNPNVVLPLASTLLSLVFFVFVIDQWRERRRPYQLVWAIGMFWYALSAGTEFIGGQFGWSEPLYRIWYLIGAIWLAGWLGLGTLMLLAKTRFAFAMVPVYLLVAFISLVGARAYENVGIASPIYALVALGLAIGTAYLAYRRDDRWAALSGVAVIGGSAIAAVMMATATLPAPGWIVDPATHIPTGALFPGYLRLLTPLFNVTGAWALVAGALFSAYVFMPKIRLIRYDLRRDRGRFGFLTQVLVAIVAVPVNFVASLPGALLALVRGRLNTRVPATILIAIGAIIPAITSGMNRFGDTGGFFVGELLGVLFLFLGFLVSVEVTREVRIPFTRVVIRSRQLDV